MDDGDNEMIIEDLTGAGKVVEGLSGPTERLIDAVKVGVGGIAYATLLKRNSRAELEVIREQIREIEKLGYDAPEVITTQTLQLEFRRQAELVQGRKILNSGEIAERAEEILKKVQPDSDDLGAGHYRDGGTEIVSLSPQGNRGGGSRESVDPMWASRFFDYAGAVSKPAIQEVFAHVLAQEAIVPGSCSLRTLECIKTLSSKEARAFRDLCKLTLRRGVVLSPETSVKHSPRNDHGPVVLPTSLDDTTLGRKLKEELSWSRRQLLEDAGLLVNKEHIEWIVPSSKQPLGHVVVIRGADFCLAVGRRKYRDESWSLRLPIYTLTAEGRELCESIEGVDQQDWLKEELKRWLSSDKNLRVIMLQRIVDAKSHDIHWRFPSEVWNTEDRVDPG